METYGFPIGKLDFSIEILMFYTKIYVFVSYLTFFEMFRFNFYLP